MSDQKLENYFEMANECSEVIRWLNEDLTMFRDLARQYRHDEEMKPVIMAAMQRILKKKEFWLCERKIYLNIGQKLSPLPKEIESELEFQNFLLELVSLINVPVGILPARYGLLVPGPAMEKPALPFNLQETFQIT